MNLLPRTVFVLLSVMLSTAELTTAQSVGDSAPLRPVPAAPQGAAAPRSAQTAEPQEVAPPGSSPAVSPPVNVNPSAANPPGVSAEEPRAAATSKSVVQPAGKGKKSKAAAAAPEQVSTEPKPYVIGSLDILQINVWNDAKLSGLFDVRPDGILSLPLIGEMKADGLTVPELTQLIKTKLAASVMEDPEVNIQVVRINSKKFYIFGGCLKQGEFPLVSAMTVLDAFANCGGFKDFANLKKIYVLRGTERFSFNYKEVSQGKHMEQNRLLQNGDRIFVPE